MLARAPVARFRCRSGARESGESAIETDDDFFDNDHRDDDDDQPHDPVEYAFEFDVVGECERQGLQDDELGPE